MRKRQDQTASSSVYTALAPHWLATPPERSALFFPAFCAISAAVQRVLRERIPVAYFTNTEQFATTRYAYPALVYMASRPFRPKNRMDFTYDVLNPNMMARFFRATKLILGPVLSKVVDRLRLEGRDDLISSYQPHRAGEIIASVQRRSASTSLLYDLLVGEGTLVNELLQMGGFGKRQPRDQAKMLAALSKNWNFRLRRMCTGHDLRYLAPELFEAATAALGKQQQVARKPKRSQQMFPEHGGYLLHESDGAERLSWLGLVEIGDSGLLMAVDERDPVWGIDEFEGLPE